MACVGIGTEKRERNGGERGTKLKEEMMWGGSPSVCRLQSLCVYCVCVCVCVCVCLSVLRYYIFVRAPPSVFTTRCVGCRSLCFPPPPFYYFRSSRARAVSAIQHRLTVSFSLNPNPPSSVSSKRAQVCRSLCGRHSFSPSPPTWAHSQHTGGDLRALAVSTALRFGDGESEEREKRRERDARDVREKREGEKRKEREREREREREKRD